MFVIFIARSDMELFLNSGSEQHDKPSLASVKNVLNNFAVTFIKQCIILYALRMKGNIWNALIIYSAFSQQKNIVFWY
jgi:hypothetical protein